MSVVVDKVNALNRQLSHLVTSRIQSLPVEPLDSVTSSKYIIELNASLNILSAPRPATPSLDQIVRLIIEVNHTKLQEPNEIIQNEYTRELEWLFVARCAVDVYGCLLEQLFQQTLPLAQDIFYWDDILSQPSWRILFLIQSKLSSLAQKAQLIRSNTISIVAIWNCRLDQCTNSSARSTYPFLPRNTPLKSF